MPLIFIALFLGSFLIGAGTSYVTQGQQGIGIGGGTPVATTNPNVTPNPATACLPERDIIGRYQISARSPQDSAIQIEATADFSPDLDGLGPLANATNWRKALLWMFGGELLGSTNNEIDRRTKTWTLVKREAPIPSWKIAYQSGTMKWGIPDCVWQDGVASCMSAAASPKIVFHEMARIGKLDFNKLSPKVKERYDGLKRIPITPHPEIEEPTDSIGDIWVATGWCGGDQSHVNNPGGYDPINSQLQCPDPLLKDFIFVVTKKGRGPRLGRGPGDRGVNESLDKDHNFWWRFDVYYNFGGNEVGYQDPIYDNLPCWTRQFCVDNPPGDMFDPRQRKDGKWQGSKPCRIITPPINLPPEAHQINPFPNLKFSLKNKINKLLSLVKISENVSAQTTVQFPQFVSGKSITPSNPSDPRLDKLKLNTYIIAAPITLPSGTEKIGTIIGTGGNEFEIYAAIADLAAPTPTAPPSPTPNEYMGLQMIYLKNNEEVRQYVFVHKESAQGEALKLRTFYPPIIEEPPPPIPAIFSYEWYTPACKPAIYLYPENPLELSVVVRPQGQITQSIPEHGNSGWKNILAKPNGELVFNNKSLPYLYYEAEVKNVNPPTQGWVVKKEELSAFFETALPYLGLNSKESTDFKNYWLKKLSAKPYYFVGLIERNVLDKIENIEFSKQPDNFIRVRFYFEGLDKPMIVTPPLLPKTPERNGFTAVDWGGMLANGTCGDTLKSE